MAVARIETPSASSSPFLFTGIGVAICVLIGLVYLTVLDFYIAHAHPSPILVGALLVVVCWLLFLVSLRRVISVSPLGIHISDTIMGRLFHERVVYNSPTNKICIELVSKRWYAFVTHAPSGEQVFICFLRATGLAAIEFKKALEEVWFSSWELSP